jgi:hypothetical protein
MQTVITPSLYIPQNTIIKEHGYFGNNQLVQLIRKYKQHPEAIQFIADMMEE